MILVIEIPVLLQKDSLRVGDLFFKCHKLENQVLAILRQPLLFVVTVAILKFFLYYGIQKLKKYKFN